MNPEDFMAFMDEHVPSLAGKLKNLRLEDPEQFRRQYSSLSRMFGPVMLEMQRSPEMGELSLNKITTRLQVNQQVIEIKGGQDTPRMRTELRTTVGKLFDVILDLEGKRVESWRSLQERNQDRGEGEGRTRRPDGREGSDRGRSERGSGRFGPNSDRPADGDDRDRERPGRRNSNSERGSGRPPEGGDRPGGRRGFGGGGGGRSGYGGGGAFGRGGFGRGSEMLDEYKANIEAWNKNRSRIIDNQIDNLLKDVKPFPWGR